ncbi:MAG: diacylglycerol kinase family protein [Candidatus Magasanikbacteria bacterium]
MSYALKGIRYVWKNEMNFRIQSIVGVLVIVLGSYFQLSRTEWLFIVTLIFAVLSCELLNSAFEKIIDIVKPRLHHQVELVKDISAGMVLLVSFCAFIMGVYIFYPYIIELFHK